MCDAQVYAPTFPGYGRSEKPAVAYSQDLWRDFLRDFVVEVVRCPVLVAGNSIGGFIAASLAADHPSIVQGASLCAARSLSYGYLTARKPSGGFMGATPAAHHTVRSAS